MVTWVRTWRGRALAKALRELQNFSLFGIPKGYAVDNLKNPAGNTFMLRQYKLLSHNFKAFVSIHLKSRPRVSHERARTFYL